MRKKIMIAVFAILVIIFLIRIMVGTANKNVEAETVVELETEVESEAESEQETEVESETESEAETEVKSRTESEAETEVESETESEAETEVESEAEIEVKSENHMSKEERYLENVFKLVLGRSIEESALNFYLEMLQDEKQGVSHVLLNIYQSKEFTDKKLNAGAFVKLSFQSVFGREATEIEIAELSKGLQNNIDYKILLLKLLQYSEYENYINELGVEVGSVTTINGKIIVLNDGAIVTSGEQYKNNRNNIKISIDVRKAKQNIEVYIVQ
jgi:hypothetical protein